MSWHGTARFDLARFDLARFDLARHGTFWHARFDPHHTIPLVRKFNARIQTLDTLKIPIIKGSKFTMHVHNTDVPIHVSKLIEKRSRKEATIKKKPRTVGRDEIGLVTVVVNSSICLETFEDYPAMGRVLLRDNGVTVAMGTVTKIKE